MLQKDRSPFLLPIRKNCHSEAYLFNTNSAFHSHILPCKIDAPLLCDFMTNVTLCSSKQNPPWPHPYLCQRSQDTGWTGTYESLELIQRASVAWKPKHRCELNHISNIMRWKGKYTFICAVWGTASLHCSVSWNAQCQGSRWRYSYLCLQQIFMQNFFYCTMVHCSASLTYFCLKKRK